MSVKLEKIENTIMRDISDILRKHAGNKYLQEVTVTAVEITADLSYAKIYYTVLNDDNFNDVEEALDSAVGFIRTELAKVIEMKKVPELSFVYDSSIEYGEKIENVIKELNDKKID